MNEERGARGRPGRAATAGMVVGLLLSAAVLATPTSPPPRADASTEGAVAGFLASWERSLLSTYVLRTRWERIVGERSALAHDIVTVQRPPDHLAAAAGRVSGRVGGRNVICSTATSEGCRWTVAASPDEVDGRMAHLRRLVVDRHDSAAWYDVTDLGEGCFELGLRFVVAAPPFGDRARWCFDATSGAPRFVEIHRGAVVDRSEMIRVSRRVADADLDPEALMAQMSIGWSRST